MIVGLIGYDSIRKHLAACGYYTAEIREKYYLRIADAYIDIKEQRGQYWLENIMKDRFAVSMFGQKRLSREGGIVLPSLSKTVSLRTSMFMTALTSLKKNTTM